MNPVQPYGRTGFKVLTDTQIVMAGYLKAFFMMSFLIQVVDPDPD